MKKKAKRQLNLKLEEKKGGFSAFVDFKRVKYLISLDKKVGDIKE